MMDILLMHCLPIRSQLLHLIEFEEKIAVKMDKKFAKNKVKI